MNKKIIFITIIVALIIAFFISFLIIHNKKKVYSVSGSWKNIEITKYGYTLKINSSELGHPEPTRGAYIFSTKVDYEYSENNEIGKEVMIVDYINFLNSKENDILPNYDSMDEVKINNNNFKYSIENSQANLYYIVDDDICFYIRLIRKMRFNKDGNFDDSVENLVFKKDLLQLKELCGVLNFSISK